MKKITSKMFFQISLFVFLGTLGIIITIIFYEFLSNYYSTEGKFLWFDFNPLWFVFSFIIVIIIPILIFIFFSKTKKRLDKRRRLS